MTYDSRLPFHRHHLHPGVGEALRQVREDAGLSRRQVAAAAAIAPRTLARIERGAQVPTWPTLGQIRDALRVRVSSVAPRWVRDSFDVPTNPVSAPGIGLRALRRERGLTLVEMATGAGVSVATLSRFERGLAASRLLAKRVGAPGLPFDEWDVVIDNATLASFLGFFDSEGLGAGCLAAAGRLPAVR